MASLSAGERRVAIAFLAKPEIVILDEPSAALDIHGESEVIDNLRASPARRSICITHSMTLSADHIVRIESGRAAYVGVAV